MGRWWSGGTEETPMLDVLMPLTLLTPYLLVLMVLAAQPAAVIPVDDDQR